jgi:hypothetical protein
VSGARRRETKYLLKSYGKYGTLAWANTQILGMLSIIRGGGPRKEANVHGVRQRGSETKKRHYGRRVWRAQIDL